MPTTPPSSTCVDLPLGSTSLTLYYKRTINLETSHLLPYARRPPRSVLKSTLYTPPPFIIIMLLIHRNHQTLLEFSPNPI
ncbi:hypothetical protein Godav_019433 [Gossypium davidsonii]|uniref:Uncharacterized protein n=1 Tax=Gossypium davidsonii TaxID=34287 RepID=A0A7J8QZX5_GOSDV|nr:hypothetical protein [Gossypium davidsonii]